MVNYYADCLGELKASRFRRLGNVSGHALTYWFKLPVGGSCVGNTEVIGLGIGVGGAAGKISTVFNNKHKNWNQRCRSTLVMGLSLS